MVTLRFVLMSRTSSSMSRAVPRIELASESMLPALVLMLPALSLMLAALALIAPALWLMLRRSC